MSSDFWHIAALTPDEVALPLADILRGDSIALTPSDISNVDFVGFPGLPKHCNYFSVCQRVPQPSDQTFGEVGDVLVQKIPDCLHEIFAGQVSDKDILARWKRSPVYRPFKKSPTLEERLELRNE